MAALPDAEKLCAQLARALQDVVGPSTAMVGIHTGGAWVAERLHAALALKFPLGLLDPAFYRDDYAKQGLAKDPKRSKIPFDVEGKDLLARALQHEMDHLDGKLFLDRVRGIKRDLIVKKIRKLSRAGKW